MGATITTKFNSKSLALGYVFVQNQTSYGSLRARPKITIFIFWRGSFPARRASLCARPPPWSLRWRVARTLRGSLRWVPAGSCAYRRLFVSSAFSPPSVFFFFPSLRYPSPSLSPPNFPSELLNPKYLTSRICVSHMSEESQQLFEESFEASIYEYQCG